MRTNTAIPQQSNMQPLITDASKKDDGMNSPRGSEFSVYNPPPANFYETECQKKLKSFLKRFKEEAATKKNERSDPSGARAAQVASESEGDYDVANASESVQDQQVSLHNAPADATNCSTIQVL